ncbi:hypothetical protein [Actinacidiphila oryziradicis]|uniref:Tetratricopeptide repeat protein n=1 Tax=Actinacidiphila oryziradicis TaxID=2571141 RepID=A0A4U0S1M5_9ACTN|nr:hypothetical protein [Actinacidiphila oryziradicis]TKA02018.1 hypothetical protein FCI23_39305 [Actinacidiphila oryziradicis]
MLETPEAVFEALRENNERPYGLHRTVTAEELVDAAEQFEEPDVLVTALLELMSAYEYTGEHRKSPVVFARVLKLRDSKPGAFSEREARQVLWRFKWVTTSLLQVPDISLTAIRGWTDQMRDRYRDAGHGMQPVAAMRHRVAAHTGSDHLAAYDLWVTRPREELSDCEACETRHRALHHLRSGDEQRALDIWRPVLSGGQGCSEEPYVSQAHALLPLLRLGRTDEARSHHLVGYRFARGKAGMAEEVGLHLEFCALSRNEGRGLEILAENRTLFDATGAPFSLLGFLTGVQVLLSRLVEDGYATTAVAGPLGRNWTAETLLAHVSGEADALAAAFDARNGTTAVGDRRRLRTAHPPLLAEPLPLGLRTSTAAVPAASAPAPAASRDIPEDFATLVTQARQLAADGHPGDTVLWERIAERVAADDHVHDPELGPEARLRAELAEQRAFAAYEEERWADGNAAMAEAAELFERDAGLPWHAVAARARMATVAWRSGQGTDRPATDSSPSWSDLDAALRDAEELLAAGTADAGAAEAGAAGAPEKYLTVLQCRAFAAHSEAAAELPDLSTATRERFESLTGAVLSEAARLETPHQAVGVRMYTADIAVRTGSPDEAVAELRTALDILEANGRPWRAPRLEAQLGQILLQQDKPEEAVASLQQALAGATRFEDTSFPVARTYMLLGHASSHAGDLPGAVRYLSEAASRFDREADDNAAAETRLQLADVLGRSGREADAVAILESLVLDDASAAVDERLLAQIRLSLARGLRDLEEHRASAEQFLRLADTVAAWEEQGTHTLVACEAAVALARADRWDAARAAYERAVVSHRKSPNPSRVADMMREFAALTMASEGADGLDAALGHLTEADELRACVDEEADDFVHWYQAGATHYRRARTLAGAERFADALAEMERAVSAYEEGGPRGETPRAEAVRVAALIEANGLRSPQAATARLDAAVSRCEAAGLQQAAKVLANLRDEFASRRPG